ncbi:MAG: YjjG family noncanonical pyrimidine nucleotidase [Sphaerochaetaceae bacterium]
MYDHLLFDIDGTLLDFMASEKWAVGEILTVLGIEPTAKAIEDYSSFNNRLWLEYELGKITIEKLKVERFRLFFEKYGIDEDPNIGSQLYGEKLSEADFPYPDTLDVLNKIRETNIPMSIITNGITYIQKGRLKSSKIDSYFVVTAVSESIGFQKPRKEYFERTIDLIKNSGYSANNPLVIGDSLSSDIAGAINSNLDSCWINRYNMVSDSINKPTYEIKNLYRLLKILNL